MICVKRGSFYLPLFFIFAELCNVLKVNRVCEDCFCA